MNKRMKFILCFVMISALLLIVLCFLNYLELGNNLQNYTSQLSESRTNWETIAAEKETLQAQLKEMQSELKEAELSLAESTSKTEELKEDIETLIKEIDTLRSSVNRE